MLTCQVGSYEKILIKIVGDDLSLIILCIQHAAQDVVNYFVVYAGQRENPGYLQDIVAMGIKLDN